MTTELMIVAKYFVIPVSFPIDNVDEPIAPTAQWLRAVVIVLFWGYRCGNVPRLARPEYLSTWVKMKSSGVPHRLTLATI